LWLYYEQGFETTVKKCLRWVEADEHRDWVMSARAYSDALMTAEKPEKTRIFTDLDEESVA